MRTAGQPEDGQPMIRIESVSKKYGAHLAVDNISFTARPGRVTGFLGPNGAGKSTTLRVIVGLTPPTAGTARVLGRHPRRPRRQDRHSTTAPLLLIAADPYRSRESSEPSGLLCGDQGGGCRS